MSAQSNVVPFPKTETDTATTDLYLRGCPHCGGNDGYLNVEREHRFMCNKHMTKWLIGSNLFSGWRDEGEEVWLRNQYRLQNYMTVPPVYPERDPDMPDVR